MPRKPGRPSKFSQELADTICNGLAVGKSLREVCRADEMPDRDTVLRWLHSRPAFYGQYAQAKRSGLDAMAEDIIEISDEGSNDWMAANDPENAGYRANGEHIARSRLRVDTRKWIMSKLAPKKYGEKLEIAGDQESPLVKRLDEIEVARHVAFLLNRAAKKQED